MHSKRTAAFAALLFGSLVAVAAPGAARAQDASLAPAAPTTYLQLRYELPTSVGSKTIVLAEPSLGGPSGGTFDMKTTLGLSAAYGKWFGSKLSLEGEAVLRKIDANLVKPGIAAADGSAMFLGGFVNALVSPISLSIAFLPTIVPRIGGGLGFAMINGSAGGVSESSKGLATQILAGFGMQLDSNTTITLDYRAMQTEKLKSGGANIGAFQARTLELGVQVNLPPFASFGAPGGSVNSMTQNDSGGPNS